MIEQKTLDKLSNKGLEATRRECERLGREHQKLSEESYARADQIYQELERRRSRYLRVVK